MKTRHPKIAQITQTVRTEEVSVGCKVYQTDASPAYLPNLCNLRNLRTESFKGEL